MDKDNVTVTHREKNQKNYTKKPDNHDELTLDSTMWLAYRDINMLLKQYLFPNIKKNELNLLDYGCGVGLSTKAVSQQIKENTDFSLNITGVDINQENLNIARKKLPASRFIHITSEKDLKNLGNFDLIICNFVLVEIRSNEFLSVLSALRDRLSEHGVLIVTNPTGRAYRQENKWYTFGNHFPENKPTRQSQSHTKLKFDENQPIKVQLFTSKDKASSFTFYDFFHSGSSYRKAYQAAGLKLLATHKPLGLSNDNIEWRSEVKVPPYKQHVLRL